MANLTPTVTAGGIYLGACTMVDRRSKGEMRLNDPEQVIIFRVNSVYNEGRKGAFESTESLSASLACRPWSPPLLPTHSLLVVCMMSDKVVES